MAITYPTTLDVFTNPTSTSLLTSPDHAQQHSDINDAVEALEAKVAIGNTVLGAWIDYTPTWTAAFTNPVIGNGSITGRYSLVNKTVTAQILVVMGSTTTFGNGGYFFSLPVTAAATLVGYPALGAGWANDVSASAATTLTAQVHNSGTTLFGLRFTSASNNGAVNHNAPYTWASTDFITATIQYKAA
jgi:hypothetical protein